MISLSQQKGSLAVQPGTPHTPKGTTMPNSAAGRSDGYSSYVDDDVYSVVSVESALDRAHMVAHRLEVRPPPFE